MDEYLPLYRAMLRATRNNTFCDTLASPFEATLMINDSSGKIYDHKKAWGR
jgi:hypothetical protein